MFILAFPLRFGPELLLVLLGIVNGIEIGFSFHSGLNIDGALPGFGGVGLINSIESRLPILLMSSVSLKEDVSIRDGCGFISEWTDV